MSVGSLRRLLRREREHAASLGEAHREAVRAIVRRQFPDAEVPDQPGLPEFAWPGGYTIIYYCRDGEVVCGACATDMLDAIGTENAFNPEQLPEQYETYDEGPPIECAHCGKKLESSYGEVDDA